MENCRRMANSSKKTSITAVLVFFFLYNARARPEGTFKNGVIQLTQEINQEKNKENLKLKLLVPVYTQYAGEGNQAIEFASSVLIARMLNRTICLPGFFRKSQETADTADWGLRMENRYDLKSLQQFVRIMDMKDCIKVCKGQLDTFLQLRSVESWNLLPGWNKQEPFKKLVELNWTYLTWASSTDVQSELNVYEENCLALGGIFPGLRWRGAHLALAPFLRSSDPIRTASDKLVEIAFGSSEPYLGVHWRFEPGTCGSDGAGLCFPRCRDGAEPNDPGTMPSNKAWARFRSNGSTCPAGKMWPGIKLTPSDIVVAISDKAFSLKLKNIYIATNGWTLKRHGCSLLKKVIFPLRKLGFNVAGTWVCSHLLALPKISTLSHRDVEKMLSLESGTLKEKSEITLSAIEQSVAMGSTAFLGSGESPWSLAVWRRRQGLREAAGTLLRNNEDGQVQKFGYRDNSIMDDSIIADLMSDESVAGPACHRILESDRQIDSRDNNGDDWLDRIACEGREGLGGSCDMAICW